MDARNGLLGNGCALYTCTVWGKSRMRATYIPHARNPFNSVSAAACCCQHLQLFTLPRNVLEQQVRATLSVHLRTVSLALLVAIVVSLALIIDRGIGCSARSAFAVLEVVASHV